MLNELVEVIANGTKSIDGLLTSRAEELKFDPNSGRVAFWAEEKELQVNISEIQVISKALSRSCIKLALLCKARPSEADLNSLLEELGLQINTLLTKYFQLLNLSYADCLFSTVSRMIRTLIVHIQELLQTIGTIQQTGNNDAMNYIAGMINDISQETSKIPMSNKVAYRRLFMETCLSMKDTIQEFKCYLDEAYEKRQNQDDESGITEQLDSKLHVTTHNKHCTKGNDCSTKEKEEKEDNEEEEEEEEEEEDGELDYTPMEVIVVETCVTLMGKSLGCIKHSLPIITSVCDATHCNIDKADMDDTMVTNNGTGTTSACTVIETGGTKHITTPSTLTRRHSQVWVSRLAYLTQSLHKDLLNLGAELYPPFEKDPSQVQALYSNLRDHTLAFVELLFNGECGDNSSVSSPSTNTHSNHNSHDLMEFCTSEDSRVRILQLKNDIDMCISLPIPPVAPAEVVDSPPQPPAAIS